MTNTWTDKRRLRLSVTASAVAQCSCVLAVLLLLKADVPRKMEFNYVSVHVVPTARIGYRRFAEPNLPALDVGGVTGRMMARPTMLSHPSVPRRSATWDRLENADLGNPPDMPFTSEPMPLTLPQPPLPIPTRVFTSVPYQPGSVRSLRSVQVSGFADAVSMESLAAAGLTNMHGGPYLVEFGDGIGNGGGRVFWPVRILWKPTPKYTDDARSHKIEGEVIVNAMFRKNGGIEILGIVHRLGYGLDEVAVQAVEAMKFKPASINRQPIDFQSRVHVIFWLGDSL